MKLDERYIVQFEYGGWRTYATFANTSEAFTHLENARIGRDVTYTKALGDRGIRLRSHRRVYDTEKSSVIKEIKKMSYMMSLLYQVGPGSE